MTAKITPGNFPEALFNLKEGEFESAALSVFRFQFENNPVFREFSCHLNREPGNISSLEEIPFMPVEFFKNLEIMSGEWKAVAEFTSSGTSGVSTSRHPVKDISQYHRISEACFELFYGNPSQYVILGLLPGYLERKGSSLIEMVNRLISLTGSELSGFFLYDHEKLYHSYQEALKRDKKVMVIGVSFALMDLAEKGYDLSEAIIVETGGMKGRRREITRPELHKALQSGLKVKSIGSEYGMTEMMSQAYSLLNGRYQSPPWVRIMLREVNDPFAQSQIGETGVINIIDLGNFYTCSFLATRDLGKMHQNGKFEVTGRLDNSDIRGCNLMIN